MITPTGYAEIARFYEWDPVKYLTPSGVPTLEWERKMNLLVVPEPLVLSWEPTIKVTLIRLHHKVLPFFSQWYAAVHDEGLWPYLRLFGGGYNFRHKKSGGRLSLHSFGGAVDHDPEANPMSPGIVSEHTLGTPKRYKMPDRVVELARECGLKWGGDFDDPMHFQFGKGY